MPKILNITLNTTFSVFTVRWERTLAADIFCLELRLIQLLPLCTLSSAAQHMDSSVSALSRYGSSLYSVFICCIICVYVEAQVSSPSTSCYKYRHGPSSVFFRITSCHLRVGGGRQQMLALYSRLKTTDRFQICYF